MKIIIYGLGEEGILVKRALKKKHQIVGFTDSYADINRWGGVRYIRNEKLKIINFDFIIIALKNRFASEKVKNELITKHLISESKIIDFFQLFTEQKVDKILTANTKKCTGIILGISHALCGINPEYLSGKWYNLAVGSEDIYYHKKVLEKCINAYPRIIQDLQYVILDLYDYTIFNYDVSLSTAIIKYWGNGGIMEDRHHYEQNINFVQDAEIEMEKSGYYVPVNDEYLLKIRDELFNKEVIYKELDNFFVKREFGVLGYKDYPLTPQINMLIEKFPFLPSNLYSIPSKRYKETIQENIYHFHQIINTVKGINPGIKVILLLMPRYIVLEEYHRIMLSSYKDEFEQAVKTVTDNNIFLWDFKSVEAISKNPHFYMDPAHLNYSGAIAFTCMLDEHIKKIV